ncbi:MAG: encapsulin-associated ferritin-like protein [Candidatus Acetothermia bacterium]
MAQYHEPTDELDTETRDMVRALTSLKEEIEAVTWYQQRVSAGAEKELSEILAHNRDEEIEHACMALEWLRRNMSAWDENLKTYLFSDQPITELEELEEEEDKSQTTSGGDLGIGDMSTNN